MGSCPNYGPFLGTLNNRCRIILRTQKGTIILTTTHVEPPLGGLGFRVYKPSWGFGILGCRFSILRFRVSGVLGTYVESSVSVVRVTSLVRVQVSTM